MRSRDRAPRAGDCDVGLWESDNSDWQHWVGFCLLVGQREVSRGSHAAFSAAGCSLPGEKNLNIGAVVSSQHRGKKLWSSRGLGSGEGAV